MQARPTRWIRRHSYRPFTQIGLNYGIHNNLVEVDADGNAIPELAESFEASADAKTWIFKIRKGVEFHDGRSLEAKDAVASVQHHMGEGSKSAAKPLLADVESITAEDKHTMVVKLANGNADFPYIMNDYHIPVLPEKDGKIDWEAAVGAGGYVMQKYDWGVSYRAYPKSELLEG